MSLRFAMLALVISLPSPPASTADEPTRNPWRDGTGHGVPDVATPIRTSALADRLEVHRIIVDFDKKWARSQLQFLELGLSAELQSLEFAYARQSVEARALKPDAPEPIRFEAKMRAEGVLHQVKRDEFVASYKALVAEEKRLAAEAQRMRASPIKPAPGELKRALERLDAARVDIHNAKDEVVRIEEEHLVAVERLKTEQRLARLGVAEQLLTKIETTRIALSEVRKQLLLHQYSLDNPNRGPLANLIWHARELRVEVNQLREK